MKLCAETVSPKRWLTSVLEPERKEKFRVGERVGLGCSVSPKMHPTLFSLPIMGTQRPEKERAARQKPLAETPGRKGSRSRLIRDG